LPALNLAGKRLVNRGLLNKRPLHIAVVGSAGALWYNPGDVLGRVLDVTCFAVNAILCIDLEFLAAILCFDYFIDTCRTVSLGWLIVEKEIRVDGDILIGELQVTGLVFFVGGIGQKYR
tara:strand:+ start:3317 stop:3673 length:357 start_codon:yes stop_codon:yes gene_type:complete